MISNPYTGSVSLSEVRVLMADGTEYTWADAVALGLVTDALLTYDGLDWGDTYSYEAAVDDATLVPWTGCWIEVLDAGVSAVVITKQ